ncbi:6-aminohexanoate-dimer hydrolase [termite gut metagenome]|uniref:6-aminohexanoate-dimer hydrolase n=1 Tax=termite gut metagenome TaxID=433724 RepID=A0A5J4SD20_9ZZZZ
MNTQTIKTVLCSTLLVTASVFLFGQNESGSFPRVASGEAITKAVNDFREAAQQAELDVHSLMVLQHGKVIAEFWQGEGAPDKPHVMHSVSKTFTATAIGFAVSEGKLNVTDKVISFFPDKLPAEVSPYLAELEIRHLLTMSAGQAFGADNRATNYSGKDDWVQTFLSLPIVNKPGTQHSYNSMATYMLSAIIQKVSGEKLIDYLTPRLFQPLNIVGAAWEESPQGINFGGWGLYIKTEDMAKLGQLFLQKGSWNGKQLLPESWIEEATALHIASLPAGTTPEKAKDLDATENDWMQGYGYQMWRCRHNGVRADGAYGQFIIILSEQDALIVATSNVKDMPAELNLFWKYILPLVSKN